MPGQAAMSTAGAPVLELRLLLGAAQMYGLEAG